MTILNKPASKESVGGNLESKVKNPMFKQTDKTDVISSPAHDSFGTHDLKGSGGQHTTTTLTKGKEIGMGHVSQMEMPK